MTESPFRTKLPERLLRLANGGSPPARSGDMEAGDEGLSVPLLLIQTGDIA
jgi:hypothetical protein